MGALVAGRVSVQQSDPRFAVQFVDGYHRALVVGAALALTGAIVAVLTVRPAHHADAQVAADPADEGIGAVEDAA
jgi:hypothetical protein